MAKKTKKYYVYLAECKYGTYYAGYTHDIQKRLEAHNKGTGAKYLRGKAPISMVYAQECSSSKEAQDEERRIKKLSRREKEELIKTGNFRL